jgi:signal peptidase I
VTEESEKKPPPFWRDIGSIVVAVVVALVVRTVAAEPFNVPSASMVPTLLIGDTLIAGKYAYGFSKFSSPVDFVPNALGDRLPGRILEQPAQRGDVIVFKLPRDTSINYVKRLIGLPGDRLQIKEGRLFINGEMVPRVEDGDYSGERGMRNTIARRYTESLPGGHVHKIIEDSDAAPLDDTAEFTVPPGHYFMMGDNRDNSLDSRVPAIAGGVGFVPAENLVGRVDRIMYSRDLDAPWWDLGALARGIRGERFFAAVE